MVKRKENDKNKDTTRDGNKWINVYTPNNRDGRSTQISSDRYTTTGMTTHRTRRGSGNDDATRMTSSTRRGSGNNDATRMPSSTRRGSGNDDATRMASRTRRGGGNDDE